MAPDRFSSELTRFDELPCARMVVRKQLERLVGSAVSADVSDMRDVDRVLMRGRHDQGRSHTTALGRGARFRDDALLGGVENTAKPRRRVGGAVQAPSVAHRLDRDPARDLTGGQAAKPVGDGQHRPIAADPERVFVGRAPQADIRAAGDRGRDALDLAQTGSNT